MFFLSLYSILIMFFKLSVCTEVHFQSRDGYGKSERNILWLQWLFRIGRLLLRSSQRKHLFHWFKLSVWGSPPPVQIFEKPTHQRMLRSTNLMEGQLIHCEHRQDLGPVYSLHLFPANGFNLLALTAIQLLINSIKIYCWWNEMAVCFGSGRNYISHPWLMKGYS